MKPLVAIHITVPDDHNYHNCTMTLDTVRVGYPNADIMVFQRYQTYGDESYVDELAARCKKIEARYMQTGNDHPDWIPEVIDCETEDAPLIFLDGDLRFWSEMESLDFPSVVSGQYIPGHMSDLFRCYTFARLHTSHLRIRSGKELKDLIHLTHPFPGDTPSQLFPWLKRDLFTPHYSFIKGCPVYYDTCAELFNAYTPDHTYCYKAAELDRYDHLNSASFYEVMKDRFVDKVNANAFKEAHRLCAENPDGMKGLWRSIGNYYNALSCTLDEYINYHRIR